MMNKKKLQTFLLICTVCMMILLIVGCRPPEQPAPAPEEEPQVEGISEVEAVSQANEQGYAQVTLALENGTISDVTIVEFDGVGREKIYEDYHQRWPYLEDAHNDLAQRIMEENTWDVDIVSGATGTAEKVREAARFALEKASGEAPATEHFDGTFMGLSEATDKGWGIAWVTLESDEIVDIRLEATTPAQDAEGEAVFDAVGRQVFVMKDENYPWEPYHEAKEVVAAEMVETQSTEVDTYTGATGSSQQWMEAVERAMAAARTR